MSNLFKSLQCAVVIISAVCISSCATYKPYADIREIAAAAVRLDTDIDLKDNHRLYVEVSQWKGTPYRYGGTTKKGVDCSGFTSAVYKKVYRKKLNRTADEQRTKNCRWIPKRNLKEGDLVFFHNGNKRKATHVGIYLKDNKFIHASTSVGVVVSNLKERYYSTHWLSAGRVK